MIYRNGLPKKTCSSCLAHVQPTVTRQIASVTKRRLSHMAIKEIVGLKEFILP